MMLKPYLALSSILSSMLLIGCASLLKAEHKTEHKTGAAAAPKAVFEQLVTVSRPITGVPIIVSYQGGVFYHVQVTNTLPTTIHLVWDESAYITTTKKSVRLLHLLKRSELPQSPPARQSPSVIPSGAQFQADLTGGDWLDCARRNCSPQPKNGLVNARINLLFKINGKPVKWQGEVAFVETRQP